MFAFTKVVNMPKVKHLMMDVILIVFVSMPMKENTDVHQSKTCNNTVTSQKSSHSYIFHYMCHRKTWIFGENYRWVIPYSISWKCSAFYYFHISLKYDLVWHLQCWRPSWSWSCSYGSWISTTCAISAYHH